MAENNLKIRVKAGACYINEVPLLKLSDVYAIGDIVFTNTNKSPGGRFGGTWKALAENVPLPLGNTAPIKGNGYNMVVETASHYYPSTLSLYFGKSGVGYDDNSSDGYRLAFSSDSTKSCLVADLANSANVLKIWIWQKTA